MSLLLCVEPVVVERKLGSARLLIRRYRTQHAADHLRLFNYHSPSAAAVVRHSACRAFAVARCATLLSFAAGVGERRGWALESPGGGGLSPAT